MSSQPITQPPVQGYCHEQFLQLRRAFEANFVESGEVGASLAVEIDGQRVVDLWGGTAAPETGMPWSKDTLGIVFSNTKPATALCAHRLAEQGLLDLDKPVAHYWPAFGDSQRRDMTVAMLLDHSAGMPAITEKLPRDAAFDWDCMVSFLEKQEPLWQPGTRVGYHGLTFGWLVGEVVRRVSGLSLGSFFQKEIAGPLGLDFWIGLPESEEPRVATIIPAAPSDTPRNAFEAALRDPQSISARYFVNTGGWRPAGFNSRAGHAAEIGAANGITNARSLARLYGTLAMGGNRDGLHLLGERALRRATRITSATHLDACLLVPTRFAAGFMRSMDNRALGLDSAAIGDCAYGHVGAGGSVAFANPEHRMGFAYTMNRMGPGVLLNERAERLISAAYATLAQGQT